MKQVKTDNLLRLIMPNSRTERLLLGGVCAFYLTLAVYYILNYNVVGFNPMGFDTSLFVAGERPWLLNVRHPLLWLFMLPIQCLRHIVFFQEYMWLVFMIISVMFNSFSMLLVFKICRALKLSTDESVMLTLFQMSLASTLVLAFSFDTFLVTQFLLLLLLLYVLDERQKRMTDNVLFVLITGVTSSNSIKVFFAFLLSHGNTMNIRARIRRCMSSVMMFILIFSLLCIGTILAYFALDGNMPIKDVRSIRGYMHLDFSKAWDGFFCEPFVFHRVSQSLFSWYGGKSLYDEANYMFDSYPTAWITIGICLVFLLLFWSTSVGCKKFVVKLFWLNVIWDFFACFLVGYGANEPYLFALHWISYMPFVLGVLLTHYSNKIMIRRMIIAAIMIAAITFGIYNCYILLFHPLPQLS